MGLSDNPREVKYCEFSRQDISIFEIKFCLRLKISNLGQLWRGVRSISLRRFLSRMRTDNSLQFLNGVKSTSSRWLWLKSIIPKLKIQHLRDIKEEAHTLRIELTLRGWEEIHTKPFYEYLRKQAKEIIRIDSELSRIDQNEEKMYEKTEWFARISCTHWTKIAVLFIIIYIKTFLLISINIVSCCT